MFHRIVTTSVVALAAVLTFTTTECLHAQRASIEAGGSTPVSWVQAAAAHELRIIDDDGTFPVRYRSDRVDSKGNITREIIECREGAVSRLILRNGHPLSHEEDQAERNRLNNILSDPDTWLKHQRRNTAARSYAIGLVKLMPSAMIWSYTPNQPQPAGATTPQIVLDFKPDPGFRPPTTVSELLTGIEGRIWIDKKSLVMTRVEARVSKGVNFGWGVLAHIYPGGTIEFEQADAGSGRWIYSHLDENITIREMMVKTAKENTKMTASGIRLLPAPISYQEAVRTLLAMPLPH